MKQLSINTALKYKVLIGEGIFNDLASFLPLRTARLKCAVITDENVGALLLDRAEKSLADSGADVFTVRLPAGETSKNLDTVHKLLELLAENGFSRSDIIIALGGGVVGDIAGFCAAVYMRGIEYISVPTSLLAQTDSCVGGKTGVDLDCGKNLCGAFYPPSVVLVDPSLLKTLPPRYFSDGMAEVIKYAAIADEGLFTELSSCVGIADISGDRAENIILRCLDIKRGLAELDEYDTGERKLLNFGHTFGHALEALYHYQKYTHGEAVAIGMLLAARIGEKLGLSEAGLTERLRELLIKFGLPVSDNADISLLSPFILHDKKLSGSELDFIFVKKIGTAFVKAVPYNDIFKLFQPMI